MNVVRKVNGDVEIKEYDNFGIISIRFLMKEYLKKGNSVSILGSKLPAVNEIIFSKNCGLAWMSKDELWCISKKTDLKKIFNLLDNEIRAINGISVDISASRTIFSLSGNLWRDVLAKGCPADISFRSLSPGMIRRTRLGLVPVAIWCQSIENVFIVCNRSVREYVFSWLENASIKDSAPLFH